MPQMDVMGIGGYSNSRPGNLVVVPESENPTIIAHEILHALNIDHTYSNKEFCSSAKYCYDVFMTSNLMDYSHGSTLDCMWKWQWEIANNSIMEDGHIKDKYRKIKKTREDKE